MAIFLGATEMTGVYNGQPFHNVNISVKDDPAPDFAQGDRSRKLLAGEMYHQYKMKAPAFFSSLSACMVDDPADLVGMAIQISVNRYGGCDLFILQK